MVIGGGKWGELGQVPGSGVVKLGFHMEELHSFKLNIHITSQNLQSSYFSWCTSILIKEPDSRCETSLWGEIIALGSMVFNLSVYQIMRKQNMVHLRVMSFQINSSCCVCTGNGVLVALGCPGHFLP